MSDPFGLDPDSVHDKACLTLAACQLFGWFRETTAEEVEGMISELANDLATDAETEYVQRGAIRVQRERDGSEESVSVLLDLGRISTASRGALRLVP